MDVEFLVHDSNNDVVGFWRIGWPLASLVSHQLRRIKESGFPVADSQGSPACGQVIGCWPVTPSPLSLYAVFALSLSNRSQHEHLSFQSVVLL